jgi:hypothetical protein
MLNLNSKNMIKLKQVTSKEIKKYFSADDVKHVEKYQAYKLEKNKPIGKRDDSLIEIEIAFRKCKRVGVFD